MPAENKIILKIITTLLFSFLSVSAFAQGVLRQDEGFKIKIPFVSEGIDCSKLHNDLATLLQQANYCSVDSDCKSTSEFTCDFGECRVLINKQADLTEARGKFKSYQENCPQKTFDCYCPSGSVVSKCGDNKCVWEKVTQ